MNVEIVTLNPEMATDLAEIERLSFPSANPDELFGVEDILAYAKVFPEGYFVALGDGVPVGQGAGIFLDFDFDNPQHTIIEITGEHQCGNHDPDGEWYYGTDISVHPDHRGKGIGRLLYHARKEFVVASGKRGIIAGGSLPGFEEFIGKIPIDQYVKEVVAGERHDPTLSFQLSQGFEVRGLLENYLDDPADDGWATLIVWEAGS